ncbi:hypothetical protein ARMGADRAFT_1006119 [Armillaria gallica]|uniref:Uncharacterized protein n=1 Tax=Armillaria gallica TaxID=47427 RepID=A0A2H3E5V6_ARMGA|nr:hypothetical protein ARMGADRAFT_1006119 [Armillaria gallica]
MAVRFWLVSSLDSLFFEVCLLKLFTSTQDGCHQKLKYTAASSYLSSLRLRLPYIESLKALIPLQSMIKGWRLFDQREG